MAAVGRYRYLFSQLVRRELRRKYKGSSLGVLWYVVNPLVLMGAYTLLFGHPFRLQQVRGLHGDMRLPADQPRGDDSRGRRGASAHVLALPAA
jgi:hypothetical protein